MRLLADILLVASAFFLPWWLVLVCASVLFFVFPRFYELLILALLMDLLYGVSRASFAGFEFVLSLLAAVLFLALTLVKRRIRV